MDGQKQREPARLLSRCADTQVPQQTWGARDGTRQGRNRLPFLKEGCLVGRKGLSLPEGCRTGVGTWKLQERGCFFFFLHEGKNVFTGPVRGGREWQLGASVGLAAGVPDPRGRWGLIPGADVAAPRNPWGQFLKSHVVFTLMPPGILIQQIRIWWPPGSEPFF